MADDESPVARNTRGLRVAPCGHCGRWTGAEMRTCCVPCSNVGGGEEGYPHQWLCENRERLRQNYPVELIGDTPVCPRCGAVGISERLSFGTLYDCCPSSQCGWREEKKRGE